MAIDLKAVFRVDDRGSSQLRKFMKHMDDMNRISSKLSGAVTGSQRSIDNFNRSAGASNINKLTSSISGATKAVLGLAGAYLSVQGAKSAFEATIGQAMNFEQSEAIIRATFQDDGKTKQYMDMVDKIAIDSPLLNSGNMFAGSKGMLTMTTDMSQLENAWGIVERLIASDPTKSIDDAVRGMRELSSGDTQSLREVFNLDKNVLNDIKDLSFADQLAGIDKALTQMNITQDTVEAMGNTTKGLWSQITERASKFFREIGGEGNDVLGQQFRKALDVLEGVDLSALATKIGSQLAAGIQLGADAIVFVKDNLDEFKGVLNFVKEGVIALTAAFVAHKAILAGMAIYSTITTLIAAYRAGTLAATASQLLFNGALFANPIGLVVAAIAGLIGIIVLLVRNWDTVKEKTLSAWDAIGGGSGAIALVLGPLGFLINAAIDLAKNWDSTKSVWENVWGAIQRSAATSINSVIGLINSMIETINKIPGVSIPLVAKVDWGSVTAPPNLGSAGLSNAKSKVDGSHANGLWSTPFNSYLAELHVGETVLPRREAEAYRSLAGNSGFNFLTNLSRLGTPTMSAGDSVVSSDYSFDRISESITNQTTNNTYNTTTNQTTKDVGKERRGGSTKINIAKLADHIIVREEADIDRIGEAIVKRILRASEDGAGAWA